jgi:hypothetical protein
MVHDLPVGMFRSSLDWEMKRGSFSNRADLMGLQRRRDCSLWR